MKRRRFVAVTLLLFVLALLLPGAGLYPSRAGAAEPEFTDTKVMTRAHLKADGTEEVVDTRTVKVTVGQVTKLRARQQIQVGWTGAHPTLATTSNPNAFVSVFQEYPVVLMECRGSAPVDPTTCWTQGVDERRHDTYSEQFPPWRVDRYAAPVERKAQVGLPSPLPATCQPWDIPPVVHLTPFVATDNTVYRPLGSLRDNIECGPILAPEMVNVEDLAAPPGNTTYAATRKDGTGSAKFTVWTEQDNASLGCSATVACTLVVVPIMGIGCDTTAAALPPADRPVATQQPATDAECRRAGRFQPGEVVTAPDENSVDLAVAGKLWWSASNWRNRISVPLNFGVASNVCSATDNRQPVDLYGSELMGEATTQWAPAFCTDPARFKFRHVRIGEPQAKSALDTGGAEAALMSIPPPDPPPFPVVNAPVAVTGFAVSYLMDDKNGEEYKQLKLDARLLAKLLTESYPTQTALHDAYVKLPASDPYHAMAANPLVMSIDPEFKALNPDASEALINAISSSTLLALSGGSDVMYSLTAYLNADPEARAWLDGQADPWGMVVNPGYKALELPVSIWPLNDTFTSPDFTPYTGCSGAGSDVLATLPRVPYGPLVASPVSTLDSIAQKVQFAISNAHVACKVQFDKNDIPVGATLSAFGRQVPGNRFMLGLTSLAEAQFYELNTAALQTYSTASRTAKFTDAAGRTFVGPTDDSMRAAIQLATRDSTANIWRMPYDKLATAAGAQAYPGTMPVFASVPTSQLPAGDGARLAQLLRFAAGDGQQPGLDSGQLPSGYLPMTAANGLGDFVAYTLSAADAVAAQQGGVPPVLPVVAPSSPPTTAAGSGTTTGGGATVAPTGVPATGVRPQTSAASPTPSKVPVADATSPGSTASLSSALAAWALPIAVLIALCTTFIGVTTKAVAFVVTWWRAS